MKITINKRIALRLVLLVLTISPCCVFGQYSNEVLTTTERPFYLVGSLPPAESAGNYAKLQIDILGGNWLNNTTGITTYLCSNRGGLVINQVTNGGGADHFAIKAYLNPNGYTNIYIITTLDYAAFAMKSCMLQGNATQLQTIVQQTPVGTDITPAILPVLITDANGNIALNSYDSKGYKFAVNGSAIATSMTVRLNANWPDYVFKSDYQLPNLQDVKTYIDKNHHLSEVPSEQEVAKDGLNLGEMNRILIKKVEELTLYLIEKDKKEKEQSEALQTQQKEIDDLKKQMSLLIKQ